MKSVAGAVSVLAGLGFGLPCAYGIASFARTGEVWQFLGYPTYGGGPFERVGLTTSVGLLAAFLLVCTAEVTIGVTLWADTRGAATLSHLLVPVELAFWIGFALPVGPLLGIGRTALLLLARPAHAPPPRQVQGAGLRQRPSTGHLPADDPGPAGRRQQDLDAALLRTATCPVTEVDGGAQPSTADRSRLRSGRSSTQP